MAEAAAAKNDWAFVHGYTQNLPTAVMITGKLVRALGFFYPPVFSHTHVDNYYKEMCDELNLGTFLPHVVIEHLHPMFSKAKEDDTYRWVFSQESFKFGEQALETWHQQHKQSDMEKIIEAMREDAAYAQNKP
jgi:hypothetical protein